MPILPLDNADTEEGANEPWPDDVKLFQPLEAEQILLPDNANTLAVKAFLRMCNLKYEVVERENAEEMSPSGRIPFLKCGAFLISELEALIIFIEKRGISLSGELDTLTKSDMRAYMSLMNTVLANAELYMTWVESEIYSQVTRPRTSSVHPWPLGWIVSWRKKRRVHKRLNVLNWLDKSYNEVYEEVDSCCTALSERLDDNKYFFGDKPTELDAIVFGHIFTILTTPLPNNQFAATIRCYPRLVDHCMRVEREYFNGTYFAVRPTQYP